MLYNLVKLQTRYIFSVLVPIFYSTLLSFQLSHKPSSNYIVKETYKRSLVKFELKGLPLLQYGLLFHLLKMSAGVESKLGWVICPVQLAQEAQHIQDLAHTHSTHTGEHVWQHAVPLSMFFAWLIKFYEWNSDSSTGVTSALIKVSNTVRALLRVGVATRNLQRNKAQVKRRGGGREESEAGLLCEHLSCLALALQQRLKACNTRRGTFICLIHCVKDETQQLRQRNT